jgi:hypothetical protein
MSSNEFYQFNTSLFFSYSPAFLSFYGTTNFPPFFLKQSFLPHYGPGVDSASNRNEYQENFLGVKRGPQFGDEC